MPDPRIAEAELPDVVEEVERLAVARKTTLEKAEVQSILRELSLPDDLVDEALAELRTRAEARKKRRRVLLAIGGGIAAVALGVGAVTSVVKHHRTELAAVTAEQPRFTLASDDGGTLAKVSRQGSPDVYHRLLLRHAPEGNPLSLRCTWVAPDGTAAHQNRFETKPVDRDPWETHCHYQLGPSAPVGRWTVDVVLEGRTLESSSFVVE